MVERADAPDDAPAWRMAWTLGWTELISWGVLYYAFSALLVPMQRDTGWSAAMITGAYSLSMLVSGLVSPLIGRWLDAFGARAIMTSGSVAGVALVLAWSRVETAIGFYTIWIGIGLASAATLYEPAFAALAQWFRAGRSRAMLIVTIFGGFASTVFLPLTGWLEGAWGWRGALVVLAAILGIGTVVPHALVLRGSPWRADRGAGIPKAPPGWARFVRDRAFVLLTFAFFLQALTTVAVAVHMIAYLVDRGVGATAAAWAAGLIGAAQVGARIMTTAFERRFAIGTIMAAMFLLQVAAIALLLVWPSSVGIVAAVILLGMGRGAVTLLRPAMVLERYAVEEFGAVNGLQAMVMTIGRAIGPVMTGAAVGVFGGYGPIFWAYAALSAASAWVLLAVDRRPATSGGG